jgi:hypothetical protein
MLSFLEFLIHYDHAQVFKQWLWEFLKEGNGSDMITDFHDRLTFKGMGWGRNYLTIRTIPGITIHKNAAHFNRSISKTG